jgi:hypothetical protein
MEELSPRADSITINADGTVNVAGHVTVLDADIRNGALPIRFNWVRSFTLKLKTTRIESLDGLPKTTSGLSGPFAVTIQIPAHVCPLRSISQLPPINVSTGIDISAAPFLTDLIGVHKTLSFTNGLIALPSTIRRGGLGLILVKGDLRIIPSTRSSPRLRAALAIISKYRERSLDVLACQEELIDNDLDEFAEL